MADFSQITERLYTGGSVTSAGDIEQLRAAGISHIINAQVEWDEVSLLLATGWPLERYLYDPAADDGAPKPPEWFEHAIRFALPVLAVPGNSILVHCGAGANRGPSLAYAILRALGWTRDGAFNLIREKRPQAGIAYREHAEQALSALGWVRM